MSGKLLKTEGMEVSEGVDTGGGAVTEAFIVKRDR
jgi:hypothetical protein